MMTSRQRLAAALDYEGPDKIPVVYHRSTAGLYVHAQKLLDLFHRYPPDNAIRFDSIPAPPPGTVSPEGRYHEIAPDEWGTQWEYRIFGLHGYARGYPFSSWREARDYKLPPFPAIDAAELTRQRETFMTFAGKVSIFEKLHALRPMEEVLMGLQAADGDLLSFLDRLVAYWLEAVGAMMDAGADIVVFGDDWGTQSGPIVAPSLFREVFKPRYKLLIAAVRERGGKALFHSCGFLGELFDDLLDLDIRILWPQSNFFDSDPSHTAKCRERQVAVYIHPDRQRLVPRGTPREIDTAIQAYAERHRRLRGGGIFHIEIENDAPFENVRALVEAVDRYR